MSPRGWVSAETGPEEWHLLRVFDDGWVEIPGFARTLSDTRANLRRALLGLVVLIGGLGVIALIAALLSRQDDPPVVLLFLPVLLAFALMLGLWVWRLPVSWRGSRQVVDDHRQARQRPATSRVRRAPGAPLFRRATTAEEYAGRIVGMTHLLATDIVVSRRHGRASCTS